MESFILKDNSSPFSKISNGVKVIKRIAKNRGKNTEYTEIKFCDFSALGGCFTLVILGKSVKSCGFILFSCLFCSMFTFSFHPFSPS